MQAVTGRRPRRLRSSYRRDERGYAAVMAAVLAVPLIGMAAFAVDVGQWYVAAREAQRAADAAALAGVVHLPGNQEKAFETAQIYAARNEHPDSAPDVTVTAGLDNGPTQLKVTVAKKVPSVLGGLFGISSATIARSAVADYAGPVPLGSPCNAYGNDPEPGSTRSSVCSDTGEFWGNVGSPKASKGSGDAYQNGGCSSSFAGCVSGTNADYSKDGYFYSVTLTKPVNNLAIEVFDPALVHVGDLCDRSNLSAAKGLGSNAAVSDPSTRYANGQTSPYCTGDINFAGDSGGYTDMVATQYQVRNPGANPWDPLSFPVRSGCSGAGTYPGYAGDLSKALNKTAPEYGANPANFGGQVSIAQQDGYVANVFRRWVRLCTISNAPAGTYLIQVKTNGVGSDNANGHNRFALRAYSTSNTSAKDDIAISGFSKMAMYANLPNATSKFYLARVPSGAAGQVLNVNLFDVGDATKPGTITVVAPPESGVTFKDCQGSGVVNATMPNCSLSGVNSKYNGQWQTISVPIPTGYKCDDRDSADCWVRLEFEYGSGNQPSDTTSWAASIEGDPVRLIE
jgi:hypothetical protein